MGWPDGYKESTYHFSYRYKEFVLIKVDIYSYNEFTPGFEQNSFDCLNKKWGITKGDWSAGQKPKTEWKELETLELKNFLIFEQPFTWCVTEGFCL